MFVWVTFCCCLSDILLFVWVTFCCCLSDILLLSEWHSAVCLSDILPFVWVTFCRLSERHSAVCLSDILLFVWLTFCCLSDILLLSEWRSAVCLNDILLLSEWHSAVGNVKTGLCCISAVSFSDCLKTYVRTIRQPAVYGGFVMDREACVGRKAGHLIAPTYQFVSNRNKTAWNGPCTVRRHLTVFIAYSFTLF